MATFDDSPRLKCRPHSPQDSVLYATAVLAPRSTRSPKGFPRPRTSRFNMARLPATPTRPSRGPWLAIGLCCPDGSSLTTASSAPLDSSPPLMNSRRGLLHPRKSAWGENPEVPQFTPLDCAACAPPIPRWPRRVPMTVASSSVLAQPPHPPLDNPVFFRVGRVFQSLSAAGHDQLQVLIGCMISGGTLSRR